MAYEFTDKYKTGIESIDAEHSHFFDLINEGVAALDQPDDESIRTARTLLGKLTDYAMTHLANEEAYMRSANDSTLLIQLPLHQDFRDRLKGFLAKKDMTKKDVGDIFVFMASWLSSHILAVDKKIGTEHSESAFAMTDNFLTGIEIVDEEHKQLFNIIGRAYGIMEEEFVVDKYDSIMAILTELKDYTILHFGDEEAYMERIGYDGLEAQRKVHEAFVEKLVNLDLSDMENLDDDQTGFLKELMDFLTEWLVQHILKMDKKIPVR